MRASTQDRIAGSAGIKRFFLFLQLGASDRAIRRRVADERQEPLR
jgi:hypothetical protein